MNIRKVPIDRLLPAGYNPRMDLQAEDEAYKSLEKSIDAFGYVAPIIWNERTGNVVGGHQRLKILLAKGYSEVEVSCIDLSEEDEKLLNLALNKITGRWDMDKLEELLNDIQDSGSDLLLSGFNQEELDDILTDIQEDSIMDFFVEKMDDTSSSSMERQSENRSSEQSSQPSQQEQEPAECIQTEGEKPRRIQCPTCGAWIDIPA